MTGLRRPIHWLIVNGDFTQRGGQEFANHALATRLADSGRTLTLIAHTIAAELTARPNVRSIVVRRPLQSYFLGERLLERAAHRERQAQRKAGRVILLGNGGNCPGAEVSWAHFVHAAWQGGPRSAPLPVRSFSWLKKQDALLRERSAFAKAALIVANSDRTAADLERLLGVQKEKIVRIWFGVDLLRVSARLSPRSNPPVLLFIGALGWDERKGLDIGLRAFAELARDPAFRHQLLIAGGGSTRPWKRLVQELGITRRVEFLEFAEDVPALLATADLLVSPARYESYGLAIQEAIMAGVPPLVGAHTAGVIDRFPTDLAELIVQDPENPLAWAKRIRHALGKLPDLRARTAAAANLLARRSWNDFADEFIDVVESRVSPD